MEYTKFIRVEYEFRLGAILDAYEVVVSKLDVAEFASKAVPSDVRLKIIDAARLTGSGVNYQHWKFILVQGRERLKTLANDSTTGKWVDGADFAVIILTNPKYGFHLIDAGRALQSMGIAAWSFGVASRIFTGVNREALERDFSIPKNLSPSVIMGFGYPAKKIVGKKNRKPIDEVAYLDRFGNPLTPEQL
jgi:nitroreductase